MSRFITRAIQFFGLYRAAEILYSIWAGKSLLWLAILSSVPVVISTLAEGFRWASFDKYTITALATYALAAISWLASIVAYRKISPKNQLVITGFSFNSDGIAPGAPQVSANFEAVMWLKNIADFPISYTIDPIEFRVRNTIGNNQFANRGATIDPQQVTSFISDCVTFHQPINLPVEGTLRATIRYGKPGKEKFEKPISITVRYVADPGVPNGVRANWWTL
jgi:hypothetical protein